MTENAKHPDMKIFWLEFVLALLIPLIVCWSLIPTNILNDSFSLKLLETIGVIGSVLIFFIGLPVGIIGIRKAKNTGKLRVATIALSILNLSASVIEIVMLILVFCAVLFGGVSV